jgi:hypothetical protein
VNPKQNHQIVTANIKHHYKPNFKHQNGTTTGDWTVTGTFVEAGTVADTRAGTSAIEVTMSGDTTVASY